MQIPRLYERPQTTISLELFPPKSDEGEETLLRDTLPALAALAPSYFSVTYGAGGSTRERTLRMVQRIRRQHGVETMMHLTCVGATREALTEVLDEARAAGVENVLALRGDPPKGQRDFVPTAGGFRYASELVQFVHAQGGFAVGAAGYPEGHLECPDRFQNWDHAAEKVEQGAQFLITQLFYRADVYLEFVDYLRNRRGVRVPIIPGVLPFLSAEQVKRFTTLCGATLPDDLRRNIERLAHDDESVRQLGVEVCSEISRQLLDAGVPGLHLYCLNRAASCTEILVNLGLMRSARAA